MWFKKGGNKKEFGVLCSSKDWMSFGFGQTAFNNSMDAPIRRVEKYNATSAGQSGGAVIQHYSDNYGYLKKNLIGVHVLGYKRQSKCTLFTKSFIFSCLAFYESVLLNSQFYSCYKSHTHL